MKNAVTLNWRSPIACEKVVSIGLVQQSHIFAECNSFLSLMHATGNAIHDVLIPVTEVYKPHYCLRMNFDYADANL